MTLPTPSGARSVRRAASSSCWSLVTRELWTKDRVRAWAAIASATSGRPCPIPAVAEIPLDRSRYCLPEESHSWNPEARTIVG